MEHWEQLCPGGLKFIYSDTLFRPGTDSFLLGAFPLLRPGLRVCDLGAGCGLLGLLLLAREPALELHNVEREGAALALAERTAAENRLPAVQHRADLRRLEGVLPAGGFDLVVSNPPYFPAAGPSSAPRDGARTEAWCTLPEVCRAAARLLRWGGRFDLVFRPERLADLLEALRAAGLEPKRLRPVCHRPGAAPSLVLAEDRRGGRPGLRWEPALCLHRADGTETAEMDQIYFRDRR